MFPRGHGRAAAQRFVNSHQGRDGARLAGSETVLRFKKRAFSVKNAEKIRHSALITLMREVRCLLTGLRRGFQELLP